LETEGAVVVKDGQELTAFVRRCLTDAEYAAALGRQAQRLVQANLGAAAKTAALLEPLLR
jgi:hypothetical protein